MLCFSSAKGGAGCSVTAAAVSLLFAEREPTLLVDLAGDQPEILGLSTSVDHPGEGLDTWGASGDPSPDALRWLEQPVTAQLGLLGSGGGVAVMPEERLSMLAVLLRSERRRVVVDVGDHPQLLGFVANARRSVLVTRPCYVALSRARRLPQPDDIVVVAEPHRALTSGDIEAVLGAAIVATVPYEPQIFRAVDAGLLVARLPKSLRRLDVF